MALNTTFTKDEELKIDNTKTLVISKNKLRPNLPEAHINNEKENGNGHLTRERHHIRRSTITVNESPVATEIAEIINEISGSNPDDFIVAIQRKMTQYMSEKETFWKDEIDRSIKKSTAMYDLKLNQLRQQNANNRPHTTGAPGRSISPDLSTLEQVTQERDNYREQVLTAMRTVSDLIEQQKNFMEKEKQYHDSVARFKKEHHESTEIVLQLHQRYEALKAEAESKIIEANGEIDRLNKQHNDDTLSLRYKNRQQEMQIKSLESQVETLKAEKKELSEMCEELIARSERIKAEQGITVEQ